MELPPQALSAVELFQRRGYLSPAVNAHVLTRSQHLNNLIVRADDQGAVFAIRVMPADNPLKLDRRNELITMSAAAAIGIAPPLIDVCGDAMLMEWVDGIDLQSRGPMSREDAALLGRMVRTIHEIPPPPQLPSTSEIVGRMLDEAARRKADLPQIIAELTAALEAVVGDAANGVFTHHDLWPNNVLSNGRRFWAVDWEFAGRGSRAFDLITLMGHSDAAKWAAFLGGYGITLSRDEVIEARLSVSMLEGAWASVMSSVFPGSSGFAVHAARMFDEATDCLRQLD